MAKRQPDSFGFYKRGGSRFWWTIDPVTKRDASTRCEDLAAAKLWRAQRRAFSAARWEGFVQLWNSFAYFDATDRVDAGFVYFALDASRAAIKIGFTKRAADRLYKLRMGNAESLTYELLLAGTPAMEKACHEFFADLHIRGEWFQRSGDLARFLDRATMLGAKAAA